MTDGEAAAALPDRPHPGRRRRARGRRGAPSGSLEAAGARVRVRVRLGRARRRRHRHRHLRGGDPARGRRGVPRGRRRAARRVRRPEVGRPRRHGASRAGAVRAAQRPRACSPTCARSPSTRRSIDTSPLKPELLEGVDCLIVRELTAGLYFGRPSEQRVTAEGRAAIDTLWYTEGEIRRVVAARVRAARGRGAQVTQRGQGQRARDLAAVAQGGRGGPGGVPGRRARAPARRLVRDAAGDVARPPSTSSSPRTCSATSSPTRRRSSPARWACSRRPRSASRRTTHGLHGLYEPIHGSAPDIAGQDLANPLGTILSAAMMLRWSLGRAEAATAIEAAVGEALADGFRTGDLLASPARRDGLAAASGTGRDFRDRGARATRRPTAATA